MQDSSQERDIGFVANSPVPLPADCESSAPLSGQAPLGAKRWLCAQHRAQLGGRARFALRSMGLEVHWPREVIRPSRGDDTIRPLFPGYLFVQVEPGLGWVRAHRADCVLGLIGVRDHGKPSALPLGFVEELIARAGAIDGAIDDIAENKIPTVLAGNASGFMPPGKVRVLSGAFQGLEGVLRADRGDERIRVLLQVLGAEREVTVARTMVEAVT